MRLFFTIFFVLISNVLYADDTNVIELHETKTLDQLVLEGNLKEESIIEEETITEEETIIEEESIIEKDDSSIENEEIIIDEFNFWEAVDPARLNIYFKNIDSINSLTLYNEFIKLSS